MPDHDTTCDFLVFHTRPCSCGLDGERLSTEEVLRQAREAAARWAGALERLEERVREED